MSEKRLLLLTAALVAVSALYVRHNYNAAFPQASLELPLSRNEIESRARDFLTSRGLATARFQNLTAFDADDDARLYLEHELGQDQANRLMRAKVPVWRWRARWFRPPDKEEMLVWLRPDGQLSGFEHRVPEAAAGARLDRLSARLLAQAFLDGQTNVRQKLVAEETSARPNRDDHSFTWEEEEFRAKNATIRRSVEIHGGKVGAYREFLYLPDQWKRDFAWMRSSNELYSAIAQGFYMLLGVSALVLFLMELRKREVQWRTAMRAGGFVAAFYLLNQLNMIWFTIDAMPTNSTLPEMAVLAVLQALGAAAGILLYVGAPLTAGLGAFRKAYPTHLTLSDAFTARGIATRSYFRATMAGVCLFAVHLSFLTAFYLYSPKFGAWSPQDVQYSDLIATPMPWVYPIAIALMAATSEEFWFRLLAIPLVGRLVRYRWMALVIPAFVWGFLHANYPQQPGYVRGIEVGLIGVAAGWVMHRFGIVATLVWHYMIDALLIGLFLFHAGNWTYLLNGVVVAAAIVLPVAVPLFLYWRNRGFADEPSHEDPPHEERLAPAPQEAAVSAPATGLWPAKVLYGVAILLALLAMWLRPVESGDFLRITMTREQAENAVRAELSHRALNLNAWRSASDFTANLRHADFEYLRLHVGARRANEMLRDNLMHAVWRVRYFQPGNPEQWIFFVNADGVVYRFDHVLDDKAAGAQPSAEEARKLAEAELVRRGLNLSEYTLVDSQADKHERRTDHSFVWESKTFRVAEARLRVGLQMVGAEACEFRPFLKLPETWTRELTRTRLLSYLPAILLGTALVPLVIAFVKRLGARDQRLHWKWYTVIAAAGAIMQGVLRGNMYPVWLSTYATDTPLNHYFGQLALSFGTDALLSAAMVFGVVLVFDVFRQMAAPVIALPPLNFVRAAFVAALTASTASLAAWLVQQNPGLHLSWGQASLPAVDGMVPALSAILNAISSSVLTVCLGGAALCAAVVLLTRRGRVLMLAAGIVTVALSQITEPLQIPLTLASAAFLCAVFLLVGMTCTLDVYSIGIGLLWAFSINEAYDMLMQPVPFLRWNGAALLAATILVTLITKKISATTAGLSASDTL
ncbi:MAG: CPBP family intramembrane metalloprotease [Candidatus Solibacter usitatus]|nr:CPBP family intramembrane metalloprotease [Candidatus Solibacter usitatus]